MRLGVARSTLAAAILCIGCIASFGCGGASAQSGAARALSPYSGHATELFDDAIEPRAVGMDLDQTSSPKADPRFRERAQLSDVVVRARVSTVTGKVEGPETTYQ